MTERVAAVPASAEVAVLAAPSLTPTKRDLHKQVRVSVAISAIRCLTTYVVAPVLSPLLEPAVGHDPRVAIPLSVTALVFDGRAVRNVSRSALRWRSRIIAGYALLMGGIVGLLTSDVWRLAH